jgi:ribosomal protein S18 acetylase RimI-like enzyme
MISVRPAKLEDCEQIAALAQTQVSIWQRWDARGRVEDVTYSSLAIYERWLHGGVWMSLETAAIHLGRLLLGAGSAWVAEREGGIVGYLEAYHGIESEPFGTHFHIGALILDRDVAESGVDRQLIDALKAHARALKCVRLATTTTAGEWAMRLFQEMNAQPVASLVRYALPARTGQGLYQSVADSTTDARTIAGWSMPLGRSTSARQAWEMHWLPTWDVLTPLRERTHRLRFAASGQEAYVVFQRGLYDPRVVEIACWTPRTLSNALLMALRDWSHREGYRTLSLLVPEDAVKMLGADAEADGYNQMVWILGV